MKINFEEKQRREELLCKKYKTLKKIGGIFKLSEDDLNDVIQETMVAACNNLEMLSSIDMIDGWLFIIMKNEVIRSRKKNKNDMKRLHSYANEDWEKELKTSITFEEVFNSINEGIKDEDLFDSINELASPAPQILMLYFEEGYKLTEIAEKTGVNYNTVKTIKKRALKKLRVSMTKECKTNNK